MSSQINPFPSDGYQHYYLHDRNSQPLAVVAIGVGTEPGKIVRGISLRSYLDGWDRIQGRKRAVGRCRKAMQKELSSDPILWVRKVGSGKKARFQKVPEAVEAFKALYGTTFRKTLVEVTKDKYVKAVPKAGFNVQPTGKEKQILRNLVKRIAADAEKVEA